eukprot:TRINITY_DN113579_c0_g1_i1.p1 TRINITY_DN113579_c0_g1~~TRINITY_DN113579_c0_g1_i1.p1  ORF type:complete len:292 (+),score=76.89 TRINITY_DN113579_c0_g1_i1:129-1004(+)
MGNVLADCQRVSIDQCQLCHEVAQERLGPLLGSDDAEGASRNSAANRRGASSGPATRNRGQNDMTRMTEDEMVARAIHLSRLEHEARVRREQADSATNDDPSSPARLSEEDRRAKAEEDARERRQLLQEQADEYAESLRIDQEREAEKQKKQKEEEAARLVEEEQRKLEEEKANEAAAAEAARQKQASDLVEQAKAQLSPEPPGDTDRGSLLQVALRLPDGRRLKRTFLISDAVGQIYNYALAEGGVSLALEKFHLVATMPRAVYEDREAILEAVGLKGQCALLIEVLDEE